ncbi:uncharacterized protein LOC112350305 [Selaginella moellendorffii]|uniref:uncharacterized protein LOC112350305 n=1 Tax=Selaginella moellendorffii TaxID=88036 RepID=UPI000D1C88CE|nr:uncharacterized protein LOC112350305 [Selaginella moellendorffii]|eukprot:XP_024542027.1 uncharacterized protein LOC112350305 [Selaginella moellendorffii]
MVFIGTRGTTGFGARCGFHLEQHHPALQKALKRVRGFFRVISADAAYCPPHLQLCGYSAETRFGSWNVKTTLGERRVSSSNSCFLLSPCEGSNYLLSTFLAPSPPFFSKSPVIDFILKECVIFIMEVNQLCFYL